MSRIRLRGLRAGNLRDLDLELPQGRWTAMHGPSGSGKTALLFGILEPVSRRRFRLLHDPQALPSGESGWLVRLADEVEGLQPVVAWAGEIPRGRARIEVGTALDLWPTLIEAWRRHGGRRCLNCRHTWRPLQREELLALTRDLAEETRIHVYSAAGAADPDELLRAGWTRVQIEGQLSRLEEAPRPLPESAWLLLDRFRWSPARLPRLEEAFAEALRRGRAIAWETDHERREMAAADLCPNCGADLPERASERLFELREAEDLIVAERAWGEWCQAALEDWLELSELAAGRGRRTLQYLQRTGLGHLSAVRTLGTLSLGESRRLELVSLLSQVRRDQLVLFDEPGMGLHGGERRALAALLRELVQQGNTVLTADPAREFLEAADEWVLLGPGGGPQGGRLMGRGPQRELPDEPRWDPPPVSTDTTPNELEFRGLKTRFLDIPRLSLPLGQLVALVGVSGSGKSTLLEEELVPRLREERDFEGQLPVGGVAVLLERALGHAAVSTIATLSGAWTEVRTVFAAGEEGRIRGLRPGDLVAKPDLGACVTCRGHGVDRDRILCADCDGLGLREDLLELRLRQRSLREWLITPLSRLEKRLPSGGKLRTLVRHLIALGMGERSLGERGRRLSLGERSRIALAKAMASARRSRPKLFLLDEPCLGLPFTEARRVVDLLRELTEQGHSFWVVEHHEVLLRSAHRVIELGPGAGPRGGRLMFAGPPQDLEQADSPTGRWLASRTRRLPKIPKAPPRRAPRSKRLDDDWSRVGRQALERDLQRELATRSPLLADRLFHSEEEREEIKALPPTAWPAPAPNDGTLQAVLGLAGAIEEVIHHEGRPACAACGGAGPWPRLESAVQAELPAGERRLSWLFTTPLELPDRKQGEQAALLQAAGFRRLLQGDRSFNLKRGVEPEPGVEVWLDRFDPRGEDAANRLRDVEHHARLLGVGRVNVRKFRGEERPSKPSWSYRSGACRQCGLGSPEQPAVMEVQLAGRSAAALLELDLGSALEHLRKHAREAAVFERASELLHGSSLLRRKGHQRHQSLTALERRLARTVGWLLFPLPGVVLLHDQPLSGLPAELARRIGRALLEADEGVHVFTDPEGWLRPKARAGVMPEIAIEAFSLEFDLETWAWPTPAEPQLRLREALDLVGPLREHFLRTEEARLRGWGRNDLSWSPNGRVCFQCRGRGGERPHPRLLLPCRICGGSGWSRETGALEDRGLRWPDLGRSRLDALLEHFGESPAIAATLKQAVALGMGGLSLDVRLESLPLGARVIAPLAALLARETALEELHLAAPASGLARLEATRLLRKLQGYPSAFGAPEWRDHHPAYSDPHR